MRLRTVIKKDGKAFQEFATRLMDLANKCIRGCTTMSEVRETLVTEQ